MLHLESSSFISHILVHIYQYKLRNLYWSWYFYPFKHVFYNIKKTGRCILSFQISFACKQPAIGGESVLVDSSAWYKNLDRLWLIYVHLYLTPTFSRTCNVFSQVCAYVYRIPIERFDLGDWFLPNTSTFIIPRSIAVSRSWKMASA